MRVAAVKFGFVSSKSNILLTGIQPTGNLHIGNYLGSVTNMLQLQNSELFSERYLMIADYHSLTTASTYEHSSIKFNNQIGKDTL
jgi:tryptophanyl-tRNA synthetase